MTVNVEYNQLDPLLRATINKDGDVNNEKGRGLHWSTFQLNLSHFSHKIHPKYPLITPDTPRYPLIPHAHPINNSLSHKKCTSYPTERAYVEPKRGRV